MKRLLLIGILFLAGLAASVSRSDETVWRRQMQAAAAAYQGGDYPAAEIALKQGIEEAEKFGPTDERLATSLHNLAILYQAQDRLAEAEPRYQRAFGIWENLAEKHLARGRTAEAEELYRRILTVKEKAYGPEHPEVAASLNNLATVYRSQSRYAEAEPLYQRALAIKEKALGSEHLDVATILSNLAILCEDQRRYAEAERFYQRALAIKEKAYGPEHPEVAMSLSSLADLYLAQVRFAEAERFYKRALAIKEKAYGPEHPEVAGNLNNLAVLYLAQGRYAEAERLYKRALAIKGKALGSEHLAVGVGLDNLAVLYLALGRYADVEPLYQRALAIKEKAYGPEHPEVATSLNNLGILYRAQRRYAEAEKLYQRALAIWEKGSRPEVAVGLDNLASVYLDLSRYAEAEILYQRALTLEEKTYGPKHPNVAESQHHLANLYRAQGRTTEAERLYLRALTIYEETLGPEHPAVAECLRNLALLYNQQGRIDEALTTMRRAASIQRKRLAEGTQSVVPAEALSEYRRRAPLFREQVAILADAAVRQPKQAFTFGAEAFEAAQLARASDTARAVANMAARFATGKDELAGLARERQDALARWQVLEGQWLKAIGEPTEKRSAEREEQLRKEIATAERQLGRLDTELQQRFPEYRELSNPEPLALKDAQNLIGPGEALVSYLVGDKASYLWVVRTKQAQFLSLAIDKTSLDQQVQVLRRYLDPTQRDKRPYPVQDAHALYSILFAPAEPFLQGVTHVMLVPDGALQSLPFGVLVAEQPTGPFANPAAYRDVTWLVQQYAFTVLPAESSLRALRRFAKAEVGKEPFVGFGDPLLSAFRRLPETADELTQIAATLGAPQNVFLREDATETRVKSTDLSRYRVIEFATHGVMANELPGLAEPALVLTLPNQQNELDDGFLTASEVAQLKLNADWVILSACNTATPDGAPEAEWFSGLAKAFFYAGSRALLVSHWAVASDSTVKLTTDMFKEAAANPTLGKAEALHRSMLALMNDPNLEFAHPMFWAPFVVVGD